MLNKITATIFIVLVLFACTYDTMEDHGSNSGVIIKTGTICGWCTVNDTLTIKGNSVWYVNYANCSTGNPSVQKSGQLKTSELDSLLALLHFDELKKLDLISCNVCFDGCDDWISFENGNESHYIRYGSSDPKLEPIRAFVDRLKEVKSKYSVSN